jgi:hypothetical protein
MLWGRSDADVAFHDNELFMVTLGTMYRFGSRALPAAEGY